MVAQVKQSLVSVSGQYIVLPAYKGGQGDTWGNTEIPNPYSESTVRLYPIGTKFVDDDRIWRYFKAGGSCTRERVAQTYNAYSTDGTLEYAVLAAAAAVGDTTLTLTAVGTTVTANDFAGGYVVIQATVKQLYRIVENTGAAAAATYTLTLDHPVRTALAVTNYAQPFRDTYSDVRVLTTGFSAGVLVPHYTVTSGSYSWGQTWGPCLLAGCDATGASINERDLVMNLDGAANQMQDVSTSGFQRIGFLLEYTGTSGGTDSAGANLFTMLQISP
ncbi:MAG: hypothetical protein WC822_05290 [Candidatus Paceibacterota bacterium]|jgi:hypothetical protein